MSRLFVAVWPPEAVVEQLTALPRVERADVRWVPRENLHITLRFLGEAEPSDVRPRLYAAPLSPASARLGPTVRRLGKDAVAIPVDGLGDLAVEVAAATADIGRRLDDRPFRGHVTLARLRRGGHCTLVGKPFAAGFEVRDVVLAQSTLHPTGARYEVLARWPVATQS